MEEIILHIENVLGTPVGELSMIEFELPSSRREMAEGIMAIGNISGVAILTSMERELAVFIEHLSVTMELPCLRCSNMAQVQLKNITTGERSFLKRIPRELLKRIFLRCFPSIELKEVLMFQKC